MAFTHNNFAELLTKYNYNIQVGDIIAGIIFSEEKQGYLVDIGISTAAYLPKEEISIRIKKQESLEINLAQEFFILAQNIQTNNIIVSTKRLLYIRGWARIRQLSKEDIIVQAKVTGINKGGLLVELENIQGFIPKSHLCYITNIDKILNSTISCKCLIAEEQSNKLILSNRAAILEQYISKLKVGTILTSKIVEIKSYGAFVSIYNIPALLHISETETEIDKTNNFFIGQTIPVQIIHVDVQQGRLSVSRRCFLKLK
uniref:Ribosomal protein S1 n=1 Tax=Batrachospermum sp. TaxID=31373 RepID=A0A8K1YV05_9FLOR|nr:ribosomal protein S1 [Batrachospermum sp.]